MNEELTPLEAFENIVVDLTPYLKKANDKEIKIVKTALKRLEKIETTTHSVLREDILKKLKALEIIKEKLVDMTRLHESFKRNDGLSFYNYYCFEPLTQEEYELLKEALL